MAKYEIIHYTPMREAIVEGEVRWVPDKLARAIDKLPQIFWNEGEPWHEANHWAITKATGTQGSDIKTVESLMKHLTDYASWLETNELDWRHFPVRKQDRAVVLYRGDLIARRNRFSLAPSTVRARMAAVIQFYRHCHAFGFVERRSPMWKDRLVTIRFFDAVGFARAIQRLSSDLAIPNRKRPGQRLEGGLLPLKVDDAMRLLNYTKEQGRTELYLMLSLGFHTGARFETITTLGVDDLERAFEEAETPDTFWIRVGPGTSVRTKFDVEGSIMVPRFLIDELKDYSKSMQRYARVNIAEPANRRLLFLTVRGNPYIQSTFSPLMTDLRRRAVGDGLRFMADFKFHQTRATFGTWLMTIALGAAPVKAAIQFVKNAMLHKDEKTTLLYVHFVEENPIKAALANEFSAKLTGAVSRDWSKYRA